MKSLVCVVIGDGSVFVVDIDERKNVGIVSRLVTVDPDKKILKQSPTLAGINAITKESREMGSADEIGDVFANAPTKKELSTVDLQVQSKLWESVVRVSSEATKSQIPTLVITQVKTPDWSINCQVVIEQLPPDGKTLEEVLRFSLNCGACWRSSACGFAVFEVAAPPNVELNPCALQDHKFDHYYAIIPAKVTGRYQNQMTLSPLSAPGLSGSAFVCTKMGAPVGYIGSGFDGSAKNEQYRSYGFTLHGIPPDLPSRLPPIDEGSSSYTFSVECEKYRDRRDSDSPRFVCISHHKSTSLQ
ncbi:hypothetical protein Plhal304r1_c009g0034731 [Plasmopara halstedii]